MCRCFLCSFFSTGVPVHMSLIPVSYPASSLFIFYATDVLSCLLWLCTLCRVDIICNPAKKKQRGAFFTDYKDNAVSGDLVIQDTPKSKAIGTMKTCSQVFPADLWHQVEIGQQQGFQVGRINGDM